MESSLSSNGTGQLEIERQMKDKCNYIEKVIVSDILKKFEHFKNAVLLNTSVKLKESLNGFMSSIFELEFKVQLDDVNCTIEDHRLIVKCMKSDSRFRAITKSDIQFSNEIYIYTTVLEYYTEFLKQLQNENPSANLMNTNRWTPKLYYGFYGKIPGLSDLDESILAVENIGPLGFRMGPRQFLDENHLFLMTKLIAEYHSLTYILRIKNDVKLPELIANIKPLAFVSADSGNGVGCGDGAQQRNVYDYLYHVAFLRFFTYYDKVKETHCDGSVQCDINNLRKKYEFTPVQFLETFRRIDDTFSVISHGDYNRNNVLFQYENETGFDNPIDIKMIDFQEIRYGTPALDLSFYMYMNMDPAIREHFWDKLLKYYHDNVMRCLMEMLACKEDDDKLKPYSYDKFIEHFSQFAFYGAMVCAHFMPWLLCSLEECNKLSKTFENDMAGEEFKTISIEAGGDSTNEIILGVIKHASAKGYMKILE